MAFSDSTDPTRSGSSPPRSPPMDPPAVIRAMVRRAVRGSNRSLIMAQNPETRIAPIAVKWRYTRTAAAFRAEPTRAHSARSSAALRAYSRGTRRAGWLRAMTPAIRIARIPESTAAAMTIAGSAATPKLERKRASRVAFPASWRVMMTVAARAAADAARASESEAGLDIHGGSFVSRRQRDREGIGPLQIRKRESAAEGGVPGVGAFAGEVDPAHVCQAKHAELGGENQLEACQCQPQLGGPVGRCVTSVAINCAEPQGRRSAQECCLEERILSPDLLAADSECQGGIKRRVRRQKRPGLAVHLPEDAVHVPEGRVQGPGELDVQTSLRGLLPVTGIVPQGKSATQLAEVAGAVEIAQGGEKPVRMIVGGHVLEQGAELDLRVRSQRKRNRRQDAVRVLGDAIELIVARRGDLVSEAMEADNLYSGGPGAQVEIGSGVFSPEITLVVQPIGPGSSRYAREEAVSARVGILSKPVDGEGAAAADEQPNVRPVARPGGWNPALPPVPGRQLFLVMGRGNVCTAVNLAGIALGVCRSSAVVIEFLPVGPARVHQLISSFLSQRSEQWSFRGGPHHGEAIVTGSQENPNFLGAAGVEPTPVVGDRAATLVEPGQRELSGVFIDSSELGLVRLSGRMDVDLLGEQAIVLLRRLGEIIASSAQRLVQCLALESTVFGRKGVHGIGNGRIGQTALEGGNS